MKVTSTDVLLDSCVWGGVKAALQQAGYDTVWIGDFLLDPGDEAVIHLANQNNRVLITLDKDFGELAIIKGMPHKGIIRIVDFPVQQQGTICVQILNKYQNELAKGALITVNQHKIRVRLDTI